MLHLIMLHSHNLRWWWVHATHMALALLLPSHALLLVGTWVQIVLLSTHHARSLWVLLSNRLIVAGAHNGLLLLRSIRRGRLKKVHKEIAEHSIIVLLTLWLRIETRALRHYLLGVLRRLLCQWHRRQLLRGAGYGRLSLVLTSWRNHLPTLGLTRSQRVY